MPALAAALEGERVRANRPLLQAALNRLEGLPPRPVEIHLLGGCLVQRGGDLLPAAAFYRPIVLRLLQYMALHKALHGSRSLNRDAILDDLWPDSDPESAYKSLRTVISRLRKALDPYMRPNGPQRYLVVDGDSYQFDPLGVVSVDVAQARRVISSAVGAGRDNPMPELPPILLETLENWAPLLPDLPYEEWLIGPRQTLHDLYADGCLLVARTLLAQGRPTLALPWAERVVEAAPWLEAGHQELIRAHSRIGETDRALHAYQEAVRALHQELAVAPSPETEWLVARLRRGESV